MAAIVVAILDRDSWDANTDIIVHVDPRRRRLTWVPRDLWSPLIGDRINAAFAAGGGPRLAAALGELGFPVAGGICLRRAATEAALAAIEASVPVPARLDFWYPLHPTRPIEEGRRQVSFLPPMERLSGERLHQWIGARYRPDGSNSDLDRLARQQVLLRALLADGAGFAAVIDSPGLVRCWGRNAVPVLARVDAGWEMRRFDKVRNEVRDGKQVLVRRNPPAAARPLWQRALQRLRRLVSSRAPGRQGGPLPPTGATR